MPRFFLALFLACVFTANLWAASGPKIIFDETPYTLPQYPFPNDDFTIEDETSRTGLRVQLPVFGKSNFEKYIRSTANKVNGFGTFSPLLIPFDQAIDLKTVHMESIKLMNLESTSANFLKTVPLDFGSGVYLYELEKPMSYFANDPKENLSDFFFGPKNQKPIYEDKTNTLVLRPLFPLEEETKYGVILTVDMLGTNGAPIRSEKEIHPSLLEIFKQIGMQENKIVYAWTFTTQSILHPLPKIREGLYQTGPYQNLNQEFPPVFSKITDLKTKFLDIDHNSFVLTPHFFQKVAVKLVKLAAKIGLVKNYPFEKLVNFENVDYFVFGSYRTPEFLPHDIEMKAHENRPVFFMISVPKITSEHKPPFPIAIYGHGNKRARVDVIGLANILASKGIASITIDAANHGPDHHLASIPVQLIKFFSMLHTLDEEKFEAIKEDLKELASYVGEEISEQDLQTESFFSKMIDKLFRTGIFRALTREGRATDVDNDGITDSGEDFFTADVFKTRNILRQTVVDLFQLVRILKNLGVDQNQNGKIDLVEGDFNFDGVSDIAGPKNKIYYIGQSMGGILGSLVMALEPEIETGILNVPGGGLTDILLRTSSKSNTRRTFDQLVGPALSGIYQEGKTHVVINGARIENAFTKLPELPIGSSVFYRNKTKQIVHESKVNALGGFFSQIAADTGDEMELNVFNPMGRLISHIHFPIAYQKGVGYERNTPEFLRYVSMMQWLIDPADPINFASHWKNKNVLLQIALGDWTVPVSTGMNLARAAGLISSERVQWLLAQDVHRGKVMPVDTDENPVESTSGSAVRFHPSGRHEYLVAPNLDDPDGLALTQKTQAQVLRYFLTNGQKID